MKFRLLPRLATKVAEASKNTQIIVKTSIYDLDAFSYENIAKKCSYI